MSNLPHHFNVSIANANVRMIAQSAEVTYLLLARADELRALLDTTPVQS